MNGCSIVAQTGRNKRNDSMKNITLPIQDMRCITFEGLNQVSLILRI